MSGGARSVGCDIPITVFTVSPEAPAALSPGASPPENIVFGGPPGGTGHPTDGTPVAAGELKTPVDVDGIMF